MKTILLVLLVSAGAVSAGQYGSIEFTSNWFAGNWPRWRAVNDQVMNADFSKQFEQFKGRCIWAGSNGTAVIEVLTLKPIYVRVAGRGGVSAGNFLGGGSAAYNEKVGDEHVYSFCGVTNYPGALVGATLEGRGVSRGTRVLNQREVVVYDFGTRPTQEQIGEMKARLGGLRK